MVHVNRSMLRERFKRRLGRASWDRKHGLSLPTSSGTGNGSGRSRAMRSRRSYPQGVEARKNSKQKGDYFVPHRENSAHLMEYGLDRHPDEEERNSLGTVTTDVSSQRNPRQPSMHGPNARNFKQTYSRQNVNQNHQNYFKWSSRKGDFCVGNPSIAESSEQGFWRKQHSDVSHIDRFPRVYGRRSRLRRENQTTSENFTFRNRKESTRFLKSENISTERGEPNREFSSNSERRKIRNVNLAREDNTGFQRSADIGATKRNDLAQTRESYLKNPQLAYTNIKRDKRAGQQVHSQLQDFYSNGMENGRCDTHSSVVDSARAYGKRRNNNTPFRENFVSIDREGDASSIKEKKGTRKGRRTRWRKKKCFGQLPCIDPTAINENEASGSMKPGIIGSAESTTGLYSEICSTSETNNTMRESEERFTSRNGGKTETRSLNSAQSSHGAPGFPKHDISIQETPNRRDEEMDHSLSKNDTGLALDAAGKGDILANMPISLPRVSIWCGKKKLLVLDLNGLLVDVVNEPHNSQRAFIKVARKSVFKRPFCDEFLKFCFQRFDIGIWSSRVKKNIDVMVDFLFGEQRKVLLFCWDLSKCTSTGFKTMENAHKPLVLKELKRLWNREDPHLPWEAGRYSPSNTLLIDDSPYKALCNPPHTAIFPTPYDYRNVDDTSLGPGGDLRDYLEGLAAAEDVQSYVAWRPFGQPPILPGCPSWSFYLRIIERMGASLFCSAARA